MASQSQIRVAVIILGIGGGFLLLYSVFKWDTGRATARAREEFFERLFGWKADPEATDTFISIIVAVGWIIMGLFALLQQITIP